MFYSLSSLPYGRLDIVYSSQFWAVLFSLTERKIFVGIWDSTAYNDK